MQFLQGQCHCGTISLRVGLTTPLASYRPRVCDCDFCRLHGAAYISDAEGSLEIRISDPGLIEHYRHGSRTAEFLICQRCGVYVSALYRDAAQVLGVVNVRALDTTAEFGSAQPISPRSLSADDKAARWRMLWFPAVELIAEGNGPKGTQCAN